MPDLRLKFTAPTGRVRFQVRNKTQNKNRGSAVRANTAWLQHTHLQHTNRQTRTPRKRLRNGRLESTYIRLYGTYVKDTTTSSPTHEPPSAFRPWRASRESAAGRSSRSSASGLGGGAPRSWPSRPGSTHASFRGMFSTTPTLRFSTSLSHGTAQHSTAQISTTQTRREGE